MPITFTRYVFGTETAHTETDIPYTVTGTGIRGGSYVVFGLTPLEAWCAETYCSNAQYPNSQTTPPLPPVYPILFSSDVVYGREHFSENLKMFRGDSYSRTFVVIQDGRFYDLTNCDIRMTFKWSLDDADADAVITLTSPTGGIQITTPTRGEFVFNLVPADTSSLPSHRVELFYDAQVTDINGNVYTVAYGKIAILPDSSVTVP